MQITFDANDNAERIRVRNILDMLEGFAQNSPNTKLPRSVINRWKTMNKLAVVKEYKTLTGSTLVESKKSVEKNGWHRK